MRRFWIIIASACIAVGLALLVTGHFDSGFVVVVLGLVSGFLSYRVQLRALNANTDTFSEDQGNELDDDEQE